LGVCMSVLIDSIRAPLGVAEQPLDTRTDAASMQASDPSLRFTREDMKKKPQSNSIRWAGLAVKRPNGVGATSFAKVARTSDLGLRM
jgi:hypothetical protein